jgi:hypothetical protein
MFNSQGYNKWIAMLWQLIPNNCNSRVTNLTVLIVRIFSCQSVYLSVIARKIPIRAKMLRLAKC